MKQTILSQFIGQQVRQVTYFELNNPDHSIFFNTFDTFDLGIEIELSNGQYFHIGWKEKDEFELGIGKYNPQERFTDHKSFDATKRWYSNLESPISDFELIYVNREWKIPAKCTIHFSNSTSVSIVLGEELNLDNSLPNHIKYSDNCEIYVFHGNEPYPFELVEIIISRDFHDVFNEENELDKPLESKFSTAFFLVLVFILIVAVVLFRRFVFHN